MDLTVFTILTLNSEFGAFSLSFTKVISQTNIITFNNILVINKQMDF